MMRKIFGTIIAALILLPIFFLPEGLISTAGANQSYSLGDFWEYRITNLFFGRSSNSTIIMNVVGREIIDIDNMSIDVSVVSIYSSNDYDWSTQEQKSSGSWYLSGTIYFLETPLRPVKSKFNFWMSGTSNYKNQSKNFSLLSTFETLEIPVVDGWTIPLDEGDVVSSECLLSVNWSYSSARNGNYSEKDGNYTYKKTTNYSCLRNEVIDVPAGRFDTFVINETKRRGYSLYWYSPSVGSYVQKKEYNRSGHETECIELLSYSYSGHVISNFFKQYWHICLALVLTFANFIALHAVSIRYLRKKDEPRS